jgi:hypothetical protein
MNQSPNCETVAQDSENKTPTLDDFYTTEEALARLGQPANYYYFLYRLVKRGKLEYGPLISNCRLWPKDAVDALVQPAEVERPARPYALGEIMTLAEVQERLAEAAGRERSLSRERVYQLSDYRDGPLTTIQLGNAAVYLRGQVEQLAAERERARDARAVDPETNGPQETGKGDGK